MKANSIALNINTLKAMPYTSITMLKYSRSIAHHLYTTVFAFTTRVSNPALKVNTFRGKLTTVNLKAAFFPSIVNILASTMNTIFNKSQSLYGTGDCQCHNLDVLQHKSDDENGSFVTFQCRKSDKSVLFGQKRQKRQNRTR